MRFHRLTLCLLAATFAASPALAVSWLDGASTTINYTQGQGIGVIFLYTDVPDIGHPSDSITIVSGSVPSGITFHGTLYCIELCTAFTGIPEVSATTSVTLRVDDFGSTADIVVTFQPTLSLPGSVTTNGIVGSAYSSGLTGSGGVAPLGYSIFSGSLPPGLSLDTATGAITGTPTTSGNYSFTMRVTDSEATSTDSSLQSILIYDALSVTTSSLADTSVGGTYSQTLASSGGTTPKNWSIVSGSLPDGLSLNPSTGAITGTPTFSGTANFTVQIACCGSATAQQALSILVNAAPDITTSSLPQGNALVGYSQTLAASGGTGSYTWSVSAGALPTGLTLNPSTGEISGAPSSAGTANFIVQVTDAASAIDTQALSIEVLAGPTITTTSLAPVTVGQSVSTSVSASNGTTPYTWSISGGALPDGISLDPSSGALTGSPTTSGDASFTVQVTDNNALSDTQALLWTVNPAPSITTTSLPETTEGAAYSQTISATGGTVGSTLAYSPEAALGEAVFGLTWSISSGALPAGLSLNPSTGAITGTSTASGTADFTAKVTDANGVEATQALSIVVNAPPSVTTSSLPQAVTTVDYSASLESTGGTGTHSWSISAGALPAGLSLNPATGEIAGTPTATGTANFTVQVTDAESITGIAALSIEVVNHPVISTTSFSVITVGQNVSTSLLAFQGTTPYTWSIVENALPEGLELNPATGAITGVPTTAGEVTFSVKVVDDNGLEDTQIISWTVGPAPTITTTSLPATTQGAVYAQMLAYTGGVLDLLNGYSQPDLDSFCGPLPWSISSGSLPPGLNLDEITGAITGTSSESGTWNFTVKLTDYNGVEATQPLTIVVNDPPSITTTSLPQGVTTLAYSAILASTGGTGDLLYSLSSGSLPAGLSLDASTGAITGTPTALGTTNFTVQVTDSLDIFGTKQLSIEVVDQPVISPPAFPAITVGQTISLSLNATHGTTPYSWSISAGSLPAGLTLDPASGLISGVPSAAGEATFTAKVADSNSIEDTQNASWTVNPAPEVTTSSLPPATATGPYSTPLTATGGTGTIAWSATGLPEGVVLNAGTGVLSGSFRQAGTISFTVKVTDANGVERSKMLQVEVLPALQITTSELTGFVQGKYHEVQLEATGGNPPLMWTGMAPAGLSISPQGLLHGTPEQTGMMGVSARVEDANHAVAERSMRFEVAAPPAFLVSHASLRFEATEGSGPTAPQQVIISSNPAHQSFDAASGGGWVRLSLNQSKTPAILSVFADPGTRSPGTYSSVIELRGTGLSVSVELAVLPAPAPSLSANPPAVEITTHTGGQPESRLVVVRTKGDPGQVNALSSGAPWLTLETHPLPDQSPDGILLELFVDPNTLPDGPQQATIHLTAGSLSLDVPVLATTEPLDYELSYTGLVFSAHTGARDTPSQELRILNREDNPLPWLVSTTAGWLQVHPGNGVADPSSSLEIQIDKTGLEEGIYSAQVVVEPALGGTQRSAAVVLNLSSQFLKPQVEPAGQTFFIQSGDGPASGQIKLFNPSDTALPFVLASSPQAPWLTATPSSGSVPAGGMVIVAVEANPAGMPALRHTAPVAVEFADGTVRTAEVTMAIIPPVCEATHLVATKTKLGDGFEVQAGWPVSIEVQVTDNCGNPVSTGAGVVEFSSDQETAVPFVLGPQGLWTATWIPASSHESITATMLIGSGRTLTSASVQATGSVTEGVLP